MKFTPARFLLIGRKKLIDDNEKNVSRCWVWRSSIKNTNKALYCWVTVEIRIRQFSVIGRFEKDSKIVYTIFPKFEINNSIKILDDETTMSEPTIEDISMIPNHVEQQHFIILLLLIL